MPFLYEVPMYPLLMAIASLLCRTWQIRPPWGQLVTRTYCWLACREDRHTFSICLKIPSDTCGSLPKAAKARRMSSSLARMSLEVRFQSFWNKPTSVVSTFEWIPFNQRFSMLCTNLIVTARNGKLFIIQTKQGCCCWYFWMKCCQQNKDNCVASQETVSSLWERWTNNSGCLKQYNCGQQATYRYCHNGSDARRQAFFGGSWPPDCSTQHRFSTKWPWNNSWCVFTWHSCLCSVDGISGRNTCSNNIASFE